MGTAPNGNHEAFMSNLDQLQSDLLGEIAGAHDLAAIESIRVKALGNHDLVTALLTPSAGTPPDERRVQGPLIQGVREAVTSAISARKATLESAALEARVATERLDMTVPVASLPSGSVHPVSQVMDELAEIF